MTKFQVGDRVEILDYPSSDFNGFYGKVLSPPDAFNYIELALESVPVGHSEEWQTGGFYVRENEITLAKQETKVTEFKAGDVVRMVRSRNYFGEEGYGFPVGSLQTLVGIEKTVTKEGEFDGWTVAFGGWVRSDDIELVSRKKEATTYDQLSHERLVDSNEAKRRRLKKIKKKLKKLLKEVEDVIVD